MSWKHRTYWQKTDWLKTPITKYAKVVGNRYLTMVASNDSQIQKSNTETQKPEIQTPPTALQSAPTIEKVSYVTQSSNDTIFATKQSAQSLVSGIKNPELREKFAQRYAKYENEYIAINADMQLHRTEAIRLRRR